MSTFHPLQGYNKFLQFFLNFGVMFCFWESIDIMNTVDGLVKLFISRRGKVVWSEKFF